MAKKKLTAEDIEKDPSLVDKGYNVGDDYDFPEDELSSEETNDNAETNEGGDTGGSNPPENKERPDKP